MVDPKLDWIIEMNLVPSQTDASGMNDASVQYADCLLKIKDFLSGGHPTGSDGSPIFHASGAWTVLASSNAVTATYTDLWVTTGSIVSASAGGRSWLLMQSPTGFPETGSYLQLLISCDTQSTELPRWTFATNSNPFNINTISNTAAPTNPSQVIEPNTTHRQFLENVPTFQNHTLNMWRSTFGDFFITTKINNSTRIEWGLIALSAHGGDKPDPYPALVGGQRLGTGTGFFTRETVFAALTLGNGWLPNATVQTGIRVPYPKFNSNTEFTFSAAGSSVTGRMPVLPMDLYSTVASNVFYRGRFPDIAYNPGTVAANTLESGSADVQRISIGDLWMLTTGSQAFQNL